MSSFTIPLIVEHIDGHYWRVVEPFEFHRGAEGSGDTVRVEGGFITDFASIPRWYRWRFAPSGRQAKAAVIHDALYLYGGYHTPAGFKAVTRAEADRVFLEGMSVLGVNWWDRRVMYAAVRVGGGAVWKRYRDAGVVV